MSVRKVRQQGRSFWMVHVKFRHADGHTDEVRRVSPVQSRRGAEEFERQVRATLLGGGPRELPPTLAAYAELFMASHVAAWNKASEAVAKRNHIDNHLVPALGTRLLSSIGETEVSAYVAAKRAQGLEPKTIHNQLTTLATMLSLAAKRWQGITAKVTKPALPKTDFDFLTFEEAALLQATALREEPRWFPLVLFAARTGLRLGELRALRWADLTPQNVTVRHSLHGRTLTTPKSGKTRTIDLGPETLAALDRIPKRGLFVFAREDGAPYGKEHLTHVLHRLAEKASLRPIGWHTLRHTFASHMVMKGVPLKVVQELLGHSTSAMTERYAHLSPHSRRSAVLALEEQPESNETPTMPANATETAKI